MFTRYFLAIITLLLLSQNSFSQKAASSFTIAATIVVPSTISNDTDPELGFVHVPVTKTRNKAGISMNIKTGDAKIASFTISGERDYVYAVTLDSNPLVIKNGDHTMDITSLKTDATTGVLTSGVQSFSVDATVKLDKTQAYGTYSSDIPYTVTVNYN